MQPIISQNMESLLIELASQEDIKLAYTSGSNNSRNQSRFSRRSSNPNYNKRQTSSNTKICVFCKACKKPYTGHDVSNCWALARFNKTDIVDALMADVDYADSNDYPVDQFQNMSLPSGNCVQPTADPSTTHLANVSRVEVMKSPNFICR